MIAVAPFNNHIYHAVEGLGFLLVKLFEPSSLPPFQHVFIPSLSNSDMIWIREFADMFWSLFPKEFRSHVYITEDIEEMMKRMDGYGEKICFEKAVGISFHSCKSPPLFSFPSCYSIDLKKIRMEEFFQALLELILYELLLINTLISNQPNLPAMDSIDIA